ncbi:MAG TPA: hypothetical protein VFH90_09520, partial [Candidatus Limnocylindria bacterium]|nr:hypothetical protein [Candidatus Limnocylindria bacterium]
MLRPGRDPAEAKRPHQLAHAALLVADAEAALDQGAEIGQAPAHHPVALNRGAAPQAADQLVELVLVQAPLPAGGLAVEQTCRPSHVEAVHPVAQGLAVHAGAARRVLPTGALQHQRDGQEPPRLVRRRRRPRLLPHLGRRQIRPYRHRHPRLLPQRGDRQHGST